MRHKRGFQRSLHQPFWGKLLPAVLVTSVYLPAGQVLAQSGLCYMIGPSGQVINLNGLCGVTPPSPAPRSTGVSSPTTTTAQVHRVKIKRREGGTPVIDVRFNGNQIFEMIVDTGASSTVLTQRMAGALKIVPIGVASVDTASEKGVKVPLGYLNSVEVAGAKAQNLLVAVAGPELEVGLLGQDFFKDYDVLIRRDAIEFHHR